MANAFHPRLSVGSYAEMAGHYRETGDLSDLEAVEGGETVFRLTDRGIAEARAEG